MWGLKLTIVVLVTEVTPVFIDYSKRAGGEPFNNLLQNCNTVEAGAPKTDLPPHAKALGAASWKSGLSAELEAAFSASKSQW